MAALVGTDLLEVGDRADGREHRIHRVEFGVGQGPDARQAVPSLHGPKAVISSWGGSACCGLHPFGRCVVEGLATVRCAKEGEGVTTHLMARWVEWMER